PRPGHTEAAPFAPSATTGARRRTPATPPRRRRGRDRCRGQSRDKQVDVADLVGQGLIRAMAGIATGFVTSQYLPVFGDTWSLMAEPNSRLRLAYAPIHMFVFGLLGALGLAGLAWI